MGMSQEIVKVTSKGQVTLPTRLRTKAGFKKGSYIYMQPIGEFVLMKKVDDLGIEQISGILEKAAKEEGLTKSILSKNIEQVRSELWKERYAKRKGTRPSRH
jgi:bifunctional DNA-binding transcriptional regulator/antitoxin component of YhaV-PrlF toxin-antitoxin module